MTLKLGGARRKQFAGVEGGGELPWSFSDRRSLRVFPKVETLSKEGLTWNTPTMDSSIHYLDFSLAAVCHMPHGR